MTQQRDPNNPWPSYLAWLLAYYILFAFFIFVVPVLFPRFDNSFGLYFIPLIVLLMISISFKYYSWKNALGVFIGCFLVIFPPALLTGIALEVFFGQVGFSPAMIIPSLIPAADIAFYFAAIGLLINSIYIFVLRLTRKK